MMDWFFFKGKHGDTEQNVKKLHVREILMKYLFHIMKQEIGVNDL